MFPAAPVPGLEPAFDVAATLGPLEGIRSGPPEVLDALRGEPVNPSAYYFRVAVYLETSAPRLAALERSIFVASAVRGADSVRYTAYRVT
jgi:Protein of unknown function (DUF3237)